MIVKNETAIIERCLAAAAPHIDSYVICDTGSTDATVEVIRQFFERRGIPGRIPTTTFRNFEQARNEALEAARRSDLEFDYILLCDADMELVTVRPDYRDELKEPAYWVVQQTASGELEYDNLRLLQRDVNARYMGLTHEYLDVPGVSRRSFDGIRFLDHAAGANRANKFERDIALLLDGLSQEPNNTRYVFYLARSYDDLAMSRPNEPRAADWRQKAMDRYRERSTMAGYADEAYYSLYRLGVLRLAESDGLTVLLEAWQRCPHRWEPVHEAARWLNQRGLYQASYALSKQALARLAEPSGLFISPDVYDHLLLFEHSISTYYVGQDQESLEACSALLARPLPPHIEAAVRRNLVFPQQRLAGMAPAALGKGEYELSVPSPFHSERAKDCFIPACVSQDALPARTKRG
jgi:glycosyltransferase involved in cell wall biosynthesis